MVPGKIVGSQGNATRRVVAALLWVVLFHTTPSMTSISVRLRKLTRHAVLNGEHGVRRHVYRAPKRACPTWCTAIRVVRKSRQLIGDDRSQDSKSRLRRSYSKPR